MKDITLVRLCALIGLIANIILWILGQKVEAYNPAIWCIVILLISND